MFGQGQCYEKPWNVRKKDLRVKTESYFHTKDDMWNSLSHTSPKQEPFYLTSHTNPPFLSASERSLPKLPPGESSLTTRTLVSQNQLTRRMLERELLQLKSNQRVLISGPDKPPTADFFDRFSDYKNPSRTGTAQGMSGWGNINDLPANRVKLTVTEKAIERDEQAFEAIVRRIGEEKLVEEERRGWQRKNRKKMMGKMNVVREKNELREAKAGVHKEKVSAGRVYFPANERILELSLPYHPPERHLHSDFSGLLTVDYSEATETAYQTMGKSSSGRAKRANSKLFPLPEKLGSGSFAVLDSRSQTHSRPATVRTQTSLVVTKPKDTIGDEMMTRAEVFNSMKEIDDFDRRVHKEATVAFSKIHFNTYNDSHQKLR